MLKVLLSAMLVFLSWGCQSLPDQSCEDVMQEVVQKHFNEGRLPIKTGRDSYGVERAIFWDFKSPVAYVELVVPPNLSEDYPDLKENGFTKVTDCVVNTTDNLGEATATVYSYWTKTLKALSN